MRQESSGAERKPEMPTTTAAGEFSAAGRHPDDEKSPARRRPDELAARSGSPNQCANQLARAPGAPAAPCEFRAALPVATVAAVHAMGALGMEITQHSERTPWNSDSKLSVEDTGRATPTRDSATHNGINKTSYDKSPEESPKGRGVSRVRINSTSEQIEDPNWLIEMTDRESGWRRGRQALSGGLRNLHRKLKATLRAGRRASGRGWRRGRASLYGVPGAPPAAAAAAAAASTHQALAAERHKGLRASGRQTFQVPDVAPPISILKVPGSRPRSASPTSSGAKATRPTSPTLDLAAGVRQALGLVSTRGSATPLAASPQEAPKSPARAKSSGWRSNNLLARTLSHLEEIRGAQRPVFPPILSEGPTEGVAAGRPGRVKPLGPAATKFAELVREVLAKRSLEPLTMDGGTSGCKQADARASLAGRSASEDATGSGVSGPEQPFPASGRTSGERSPVAVVRSLGRGRGPGRRHLSASFRSGPSAKVANAALLMSHTHSGSILPFQAPLPVEQAPPATARELKLQLKNNQVLQDLLRRQSSAVWRRPRSLRIGSEEHAHATGAENHSGSARGARDWRRIRGKLTLLTATKRRERPAGNTPALLLSSEADLSGKSDEQPGESLQPHLLGASGRGRGARRHCRSAGVSPSMSPARGGSLRRGDSEEGESGPRPLAGGSQRSPVVVNRGDLLSLRQRRANSGPSAGDTSSSCSQISAADCLALGSPASSAQPRALLTGSGTPQGPEPEFDERERRRKRDAALGMFVKATQLALIQQRLKKFRWRSKQRLVGGKMAAAAAAASNKELTLERPRGTSDNDEEEEDDEDDDENDDEDEDVDDDNGDDEDDVVVDADADADVDDDNDDNDDNLVGDDDNSNNDNIRDDDEDEDRKRTGQDSADESDRREARHSGLPSKNKPSGEGSSEPEVARASPQAADLTSASQQGDVLMDPTLIGDAIETFLRSSMQRRAPPEQSSIQTGNDNRQNNKEPQPQTNVGLIDSSSQSSRAKGAEAQLAR